MRNYIDNGALWRRMPYTAEMQQFFAAHGWSAGCDASVSPPELVSVANVDHSTPFGWVPGFGGGPGGEAKYTFQVLDIPPGDARFPGNPRRILWFGWTKQPNGAPNSQQSGWEAGSIHHDPAPEHTYDWRLSILEQSAAIPNAPELFGARIGYSFFALAGGKPITLRPMIASYYGHANEFFLHDLTGHEKTIQPTDPAATEFCGFFDVPAIPRYRADGSFQPVGPGACVGFVVDTTTKDLGTVMYYGFKLGKFPSDWSGPASDIKNLVEDQSGQ